jgi:hypothetical protein
MTRNERSELFFALVATLRLCMERRTPGRIKLFYAIRELSQFHDLSFGSYATLHEYEHARDEYERAQERARLRLREE